MRFSVYVRKFSNYSFLCVCAVIMDSLFSDEELFLTQNSFSEERVEDNFSIDSILDGLVACDEPVSQNSCEEELKQVVTEKSIKDGRTDPSNYPEAVRKIVIVDDEELEKRKESRIPPNTRINTSWAVRAWSEWALERNGMIAIKGETGITLPEVNPDILNITHKEEVNYWLSKFVVEVRKKKDPGTFYPPNTLYQLCCGLQRYMRDNGRPELNFFTDTSFKHFQDCLDAEMKRLTAMGIGSNVKEAQAFSEDEENKLWNLGLLGDSSPRVLLDTMVFLIGKNFSLRSGKEHRNLKLSQLTLEPANEKEPEKLIYVSFGEKNNLGGLKHRSFKQKRIEHYANNSTPDRCLVHLYKKYVSKCPESAMAKNVFYLTPRRGFKHSDDVWYGNTAVGHNILGETVKRLCKDAEIEGQFTNHSLRATTATRALKKGIPDKFVMQRTGHRDVRSLQKYQRPETSTKIEFS